MRPKSLLLLALALGCGLVASIGISQVMDKGEGVVGYETQPIYVALHNINLNDPIDASMVSLQDWPKDKIPQGAISKLEELENRRPRTTIIEGEPILEPKLLGQGEVYDPIGNIPPGMRLKTISVDAEKSAAGLLSPGDRVDLQLFVNRNPGQGFNTARTKVILQNIRIFAIDADVQRAADGGEGRTIAKTVSLLLTPDQSNRVSLAEQIGELNLIPRSPDDPDTISAVEITVDELMGNAGPKVKNTVEEEQNRPGRNSKESTGGFLTGLMAQVQRAANERPPFVMTIIEADEVRQVEFDPYTGKPLGEVGGSRSAAAAAAVRTRPASTSRPATGAEAELGLSEDDALSELDELEGVDFPVDFLGE